MSIKKNKKKSKDISKESEISTFIWVLLGISLLLWSAYRYELNMYISCVSVETRLNVSSEEEIISIFDDNNYFKSALQEYEDEIEFLNYEISTKEEDSEAYNELVEQRDLYVKNKVRWSLNRVVYREFTLYALIDIVIGCSICIIIFVIDYLLVKFKKYKAYMWTNIIEILFLVFTLISDVILKKNLIISMNSDFDGNISIVLILIPIILGYMNYVTKKKA